MKYNIGDKVIAVDGYGLKIGTIISTEDPQSQNPLHRLQMYGVGTISGFMDLPITTHSFYDSEIVQALGTLDGLEHVNQVNDLEQKVNRYSASIMYHEEKLVETKLHHKKLYEELVATKAAAQNLYNARAAGSRRV